MDVKLIKTKRDAIEVEIIRASMAFYMRISLLGYRLR